MENKIVCEMCGREIPAQTTVVQSIKGQVFCADCISKCYKALKNMEPHIEKAEKTRDLDTKAVKLAKPTELKKYLDGFIEGQEKAKQVLSVAIYNHYKKLVMRASGKATKGIELEKSNVLLIGPSGCGKTAILRSLAKALKVPFVMADATAYSSSGYVGRDVEMIIRDLLNAAGGDVEAAERGIVYIDEIDKIGRKGENVSTTADPGHEGVQQAILKLLEGSVLEIPDKGQRVHPDAKMTRVNTENILFIVGGAFEGIEKIIAARLRKQLDAGTMGFGSQLVDTKNQRFNEFIEQVTTDDLKKFGMLPEVLGRVPIIAPMKELSEEQLVHILYHPKNALIRQYKELLSYDNVVLDVTEEAMRAIAKEAIARKTGARGLRGIMEEILGPVMFSAPDRGEDITLDVDKDGKIAVIYQKHEDVKREAV